MQTQAKVRGCAFRLNFAMRHDDLENSTCASAAHSPSKESEDLSVATAARTPIGGKRGLPTTFVAANMLCINGWTVEAKSICTNAFAEFPYDNIIHKNIGYNWFKRLPRPNIWTQIRAQILAQRGTPQKDASKHL